MCYENAKKSSVQDTGFENNASRIGVKGKFKLLKGLIFPTRLKMRLTQLMARRMVIKFSKKEIHLLL